MEKTLILKKQNGNSRSGDKCPKGGEKKKMKLSILGDDVRYPSHFVSIVYPVGGFRDYFYSGSKKEICLASLLVRQTNTCARRIWLMHTGEVTSPSGPSDIRPALSSGGCVLFFFNFFFLAFVSSWEFNYPATVHSTET